METTTTTFNLNALPWINDKSLKFRSKRSTALLLLVISLLVRLRILE